MKNILLLLFIGITQAYSQDVITLKSGDELKGNVTKVGVSEIEFKKDSASPIYAVKKSEVFMIKYSDGRKDVFAVAAPKPSIEELERKYLKHKKVAIGLTVTGGVLLVAGSILIPTAYSQTRGSALFYTGIGCYAASVPLIIAGTVSIGKYAKYKRQWKEQKKELAFSPNGIRLTF